MKATTRSNWVTIAGLLLALPTAYFIFISLLKYELNVDGPFDAIAPFLEQAGIGETLGWNINLLILFGPVIGFLMAIFQVLRIHWDFGKDDFVFQFTIRRRWFPILVAGFSISMVGFLSLYMFLENLNHLHEG
jgi:hypothetical protein